MRILITRPLEDARDTAQRLIGLGHEAVIAPLLDIHFREGPTIALDGIQAIAATSANGVRALGRRTPRRDVPIFAVGPQTTEAARAEGFLRIRDADGDAENLAAAIPTWASPDKGAVLHAAGSAAPKALAAKLENAGFIVRRESLYEARAVDHLPENATRALRENMLDAVMLFSPHSAQILVRLLSKAELTDACSRLIAFCISRATADAIASLEFCDIRVAARPNQEALFRFLA